MKNNTTWAGKVSVPGFNVSDQQSFANNPAAQNAVFATHLGNIDQAIAATPGANRFDQNGLRAVAHLGGVEGMQKFVASGGAFSPSDANGTSLSAYYNKFSGGTPGGTPTAAAAPPTQFAGPGGAPTLPPAATDTPPGPAQPPGGHRSPGSTAWPATAGASALHDRAAEATPHRGELAAVPGSTRTEPPCRGARDAVPQLAAAKAQATALRAQAALYMQADSVSYDPMTGIQTKPLTGERLNAAAPNAHYVWNQDQGAYVDTTGVHPPVTPPSPRITMTPGGAPSNPSPGAVPRWSISRLPTTPPTASYDQQAKAYAGDIPTIKTIGESGRAAQASSAATERTGRRHQGRADRRHSRRSSAPRSLR